MSIIAKRHYSLTTRRLSNHEILQNRRRSSACEVTMEEVRQLGKNGEGWPTYVYVTQLTSYNRITAITFVSLYRTGQN